MQNSHSRKERQAVKKIAQASPQKRQAAKTGAQASSQKRQAVKTGAKASSQKRDRIVGAASAAKAMTKCEQNQRTTETPTGPPTGTQP